MSSAWRSQLRPSTRTLPVVGGCSPSRISTVVVFPAPFGPSRPTHCPGGTSRSIPSTATTSSNRFTSPRTSIASALIASSMPKMRQGRGAAALEQCLLEREHPPGLACALLVLVPEQVEDAVRQVAVHLLVNGPPLLARGAVGGVERDHHVPQRP